MVLCVYSANLFEEEAKIIKITVHVADSDQQFRWLVGTFRGVRTEETESQQQQRKRVTRSAEKGASRTAHHLAVSFFEDGADFVGATRFSTRCVLVFSQPDSGRPRLEGQPSDGHASRIAERLSPAKIGRAHV